jgi:hypothetical protein
MRFSIFLSFIALLGRICPIRADDVASKGFNIASNIIEFEAPLAVEHRGVEHRTSYKRPTINEHEWVSISTVFRVLGAEVNASRATSEHTHKISKIKELVEPLYSVMPKDHDGKMSKETARYALHRYFTEKHGWSIKGLQPAGAAWRNTVDVATDIVDINKYMLPAYMEDAVLVLMNKTKLDLEGLAVLIASYEHLDHQMMLSTLHSIIATLDMTDGGFKFEDEVRDILEAYLIIYAFGANIDASNKYEIRDLKAHLQLNNPSWYSLASFMWDIKTEMFPKSDLDFRELGQVALAFGYKYAKWQEDDCIRARNYLVGLPSYKHGAVHVKEIHSTHAPGRRTLFTEPPGFVMDIGVVTGKAHPKRSRFVVPNYLNSQSMCLTTASFHSVCCENKCEALYAKLEQGIGAPVAKPEQIAKLVDSLPGEKFTWSLQGLRSIANKHGEIKLHSRIFAKWMHHTFPLDCPLPVLDGQTTNPKTPDEWMDSCQDEDTPVQLFADLLKQVATVWDMTMGMSIGKNLSSSHAEPQAYDEVILVAPTPTTEVTKEKKSPLQWYFLTVIPSAFFVITAVLQTVKCGTRCLATSFDESSESSTVKG